MLVRSFLLLLLRELHCIDMAESDHIYTHTIIGKGQETYRDKTVVILGGGDGGILHELLKESPKFVVMIDISLRSCVAIASGSDTVASSHYNYFWC